MNVSLHSRSAAMATLSSISSWTAPGRPSKSCRVAWVVCGGVPSVSLCAVIRGPGKADRHTYYTTLNTIPLRSMHSNTCYPPKQHQASQLTPMRAFGIVMLHVWRRKGRRRPHSTISRCCRRGVGCSRRPCRWRRCQAHHHARQICDLLLSHFDPVPGFYGALVSLSKQATILPTSCCATWPPSRWCWGRPARLDRALLRACPRRPALWGATPRRTGTRGEPLSSARRTLNAEETAETDTTSCNAIPVPYRLMVSP